MNSAISNLRPYGSQIVKLILFFYSDGAFFFFFFWSFSFPCLSSLSLILALSFQPFLSLSLSDKTQAGASSQVDLYRNGFFFLFFFSLWFDGRFGSGCVDYGFGILGYFTPWVPIWAYFGGFVIWF